MVAVSSSDQTWSLHDYANGKKMLQLEESAKVSSIRIHPDGLIMAVGLSNGKIKVYDMRDMALASELEAPVEGTAVSKLEFSNKGIFLAAAWTGLDSCRVYSLHKGFAFSEIKSEGSTVTTLEFDLFGQFLAVGSTESLSVFSYKNWKKTLVSLRPFDQGPVSHIRFDGSGRKIYVGSESVGSLKTLSLA